MTDQERREEGAEGELLNELLDAAEAPATRPAATTASESEVAAPAQAADEAGDVPAHEDAAAESEAQGDQAVTETVESGEPVAEAEAETTVEAEAESRAEALLQAEAVGGAEAEAVGAEAEAVGAEAEAVGAEAEAVGAEAEAVGAEAEAVGAEAEAVAQSGTEAASSTETPAAPDGDEGASFTPAEDDGGRPRRLKDLEPGMELDGRVTSIALYGIFVDIGVGRDGLVHISEMSDTRIDSPSDMVQINDMVQVRIKSIDPDARRISLTMRSQSGARRGRSRRAEVDRSALGSLKPGDTIEGTITGLAPFGAFADIGVGKDGLIHISELAEGRVDKPEDAVRVGDVYTFKVIEVDPDGTRISLSLRRALRSQKMQQLEPGQILEGTVSGLAPFGAFVDIGVGRDGLVHISALSEARVARVEDVVQVGDKVQVRVLEVDSQSKRISLTMRLSEPEPAETTTESSETELRTSSSNNFNRFSNEVRENQSRREETRRRGRDRRADAAPAAPETYTVGDDEEEEFEGNATLEDLLSKFGSPGARRERDRRREDEEDEEEYDDRRSRKQRDAIRRTLQQVGSDE